jgi:hypothetical protein
MRGIETEFWLPSTVGRPTFDAAVQSNSQSSRGTRATADSARISGLTIQLIKWTDSEAAFQLADRGAIHFFASRGLVEWQLLDEKPFFKLTHSWTSDPEVIRLRTFSPSGGSNQSEMDRHSIAASFRGSMARRIVTDEFGVYLHVLGTSDYLSLHAHRLRASHESFLIWFQDKD